MKKKKLLSSILACSMLLSTMAFTLSACNGEVDKPDVTTTAPVEEEEDEDLPTTYVNKKNLAYVSSLDSYKKTDWTAKWIWSESTQKNSYTAFRKTFTLSEKPSKAIASIAAENSYWLWVNGTLVVYDGGYKRGATLYDTYYEEVDLADYLVKGENTIAVLVNYWGRSSTSSSTAGEAGFLFELDTGKDKIVSNKSFKVMRLSAYKNDRLMKEGLPDYSLNPVLAEYNLYYVAKDSVGDFTSPSFDDSDWKKATVVANVGTEPFNDTYLCTAPLFKFDKEYTDLKGAQQYIGKKFTEKTVIDIDMGSNRQFSPYFELESDNDGAQITYYTDTFTTQDLHSFKDDYIAKKGKQTYESYPWRSGKHLIIEVPAGVTFTKIAVRYNGFATEQVGSFTSSDEQLTTLWQNSANTSLICMRDTYMDCPDRERSPWAGDVANIVAQTVYAFDQGAHDLTKKTILSVVGWTQSGTGTAVDDVIPLRVPCMKVTEWAAQDLAFLNAVNDYYMYTGDKETVKLFYPIAKNYLKLWSMEENGLIKYRQSDSTWADWGTGFVDNTILQNCQYYMALKDCLGWAKDFGETADVSFYEERMSSMEKAFRPTFLKEGGFTSGKDYDDRANAMAVVSGLANKEDYPIVDNVLKTTYNCSIYMERYVQEALCIMGDFDTFTARTKDRYKNMLASEYDTLWEDFTLGENMIDGTPNHGWAGGPLISLSKYYVGVTPTKAGFEAYEICPNGNLDSFKSVVPTPKGNITVSFEKKNGVTTIKIDTIKAEGTIKIPASLGTNVSVSGNATGSNGVYTIASGSVTFTIS